MKKVLLNSGVEMPISGFGVFQIEDPQARPVSRSRFAIADHVIRTRPEEVGLHARITPRTLTLLMSHNYSYDLDLQVPAGLPGALHRVMGPRKRSERMLSELEAGEEVNCLDEAGLARLYSPAGPDIGANTFTEIALAIIAEMRAVPEGRRGGSLRERRGSIHGSTAHGESISLAEEMALPAVVA